MKPDTTDLVARLEGLGAALRPFAKLASRLLYLADDEPVWLHTAKGTFNQPREDDVSAADFRRAAEAITALPALLAAVREGEAEVERPKAFAPDTDGPVNFYERDFYPLSNFSSFKVRWGGRWLFDTSEALYHWLRFSTGDAANSYDACQIAVEVASALSAHEAFRIAQDNKHLQRSDWPDVKVGFMREIVRTKAVQHEYVHRKLLATGDRLLIEGSWRDDFWGVGPNGDGQNVLGKLWMELRDELSASSQPPPTHTNTEGSNGS